MRHLKKAETCAKSLYNRNHSNGEGSEHEDIPEWAKEFFSYFEALDSYVSPNQHAASIRNEQNRVVASLVGRQAPLGITGNDGPVPLCNETSPNIGDPILRQQVIGNVSTERVLLQEGRDDASIPSPVQRRHISNGIRQCNVHLTGFSPDHNDPSARFNNIIAGYESMNRLTNAIATLLTSQQANIPRCNVIEVVCDYNEVSNLMQHATTQYLSFMKMHYLFSIRR